MEVVWDLDDELEEHIGEWVWDDEAEVEGPEEDWLMGVDEYGDLGRDGYVDVDEDEDEREELIWGTRRRKERPGPVLDPLFEYVYNIPVMQLIGIVSLIYIFILNYSINHEYVLRLGEVSWYVRAQPPVIAAILGFVAGIVIYLFAKMDTKLKKTVAYSVLIICILFFGAAPLMIFAATSDLNILKLACIEMFIELFKLVALAIYWAPMILGVYGIWARKRVYVGMSALFLFMIPLILNVVLLILGEPPTNSSKNLPLYVVYAIALFCYVEMSDSAIRFYEFTKHTPYPEVNKVYAVHLRRILRRYFMYFLTIIFLSVVVTGFIFKFNALLIKLGSEQFAESLELNSIYGILTASIIVFIGLGILVTISNASIAIRKYSMTIVHRLLRIKAKSNIYEKIYGERASRKTIARGLRTPLFRSRNARVAKLGQRRKVEGLVQ